MVISLSKTKYRIQPKIAELNKNKKNVEARQTCELFIIFNGVYLKKL